LSRHLFIGDIQGCREELEALLEALRFDPSSDVLLPVGDLVNRGPDSAGTLRLLKSLDARAVLGNHDLHLLRTAAGTRAPGRRDTLQDVLEADDREELLAWVRALPFARQLEGHLLVHAGIHPAWSDPVAQLAGVDPMSPHPDSDFVTRVRLCDSSGHRPEENGEASSREFEPWHRFAPRESDRTIVFGHWAEQGLFIEPGLRGLDSGCVWGNSLTAWIAEEDRIVQVPAARAYADHG